MGGVTETVLGIREDICFRLNVNKYNDIVFRKDEE